jgi:hypothetical protein
MVARFFPVTGNVSSFQPEDRRDWVQNLLAAAKVEETQEEKDIKEAARMAAERWGHGAALGGEDDQQDDLLARVPAPMLGTLDKERTMKRLDSSSALITVDGAESAISWRVRLMQLRALNSDAGNSSGAYPSVRFYILVLYVFGAIPCEHRFLRCRLFKTLSAQRCPQFASSLWFNVCMNGNAVAWFVDVRICLSLY